MSVSKLGKVIPKIIVHGGIRTIPPEKDFTADPVLYIVKKSAEIGYVTLDKGGGALEAVRNTITNLEDHSMLNCGHGSAISITTGTIETEACIMDGSNLKVGSVQKISRIKNPIVAAFEQLRGSEIQRFAIIESEVLKSAYALRDYYYVKQAGSRRDILLERYRSGVGAVAIDSFGNIAAGSSGIGQFLPQPEEIAKNCVCGGTWADNKTGGVSVAGFPFIVENLSIGKRIARQLEQAKGLVRSEVEKILTDCVKLMETPFGAIYIARNGGTGITIAGQQLPWALIDGGKLQSGNKAGS